MRGKGNGILGIHFDQFCKYASTPCEPHREKNRQDKLEEGTEPVFVTGNDNFKPGSKTGILEQPTNQTLEHRGKCTRRILLYIAIANINTQT